MNRRFFTLALCATSLVSLGDIAHAQNAVVESVNTYLTNLKTATAQFTQESADGSILTGTFYLQKPGRLRFEYDPPSPAMIIADGQIMAIYDAKSSRGPQRYPQSKTPLSLLTRNDIDVTKSRFVRLIEVKNDQVHVTMFDPEKPDNGTMRMIFDQDPMELVAWVVVDGAGLESVVKLGDLTTNISLENRLFSIPYANQQLEASRD